MRRIDLTPYTVPAAGGKEEEFRLRESLASLLFHPNQRINGRENLILAALADKIEQWPDMTLLLEDAEYRKLEKAIDTFEGFLSRAHSEMIRRVLHAEEVKTETLKVVK